MLLSFESTAAAAVGGQATRFTSTMQIKSILYGVLFMYITISSRVIVTRSFARHDETEKKNWLRQAEGNLTIHLVPLLVVIF